MLKLVVRHSGRRVKPSPKPRVAPLQLSLRQPKKLRQRRRRRLPIKELKLHWSKILRKIVLVDVALGCTLTVWYVVADVWFGKTDP